MRKIWILGIVLLIQNITASSLLDLDKIFNEAVFYPELIEFQHYPGDNSFFTYINNHSEIIKASFYDSTYQEVLLSANDFYKDSIFYIWEYQISADGNLILFTTDIIPVFRHSLLSKYYLYDRNKKTIVKINNGKRILGAEISPNGEYLAFVSSFNIFLQNINSGNQVTITRDGKVNHIINGSPDWLYEEEFSVHKGFNWSPDGNKLAFYKFQIDEIPDYILKKYNQIYPEIIEYKFPKAGGKNAQVSINVYDVNTQKTTSIKTGDDKDIYLPRMKWSPWEDTLAFVRLNRSQDKAEIILANVKTGISNVIFTDVSNTFIEEPGEDYLFFLNKTNEIVITSEKDGYTQYFLYNTKGEYLNKISSSNTDGIELITYDDNSRNLYFKAFGENPIENHVYFIHVPSGKKQILSRKKGSNNAFISKNYDAYILEHSSVHDPNNYTVYNSRNQTSWILEDNSHINESMVKYQYISREFITIPGKHENLNAYIIKPPNMNEKKKYPVLVFVYGGPGSQKVMNEWLPYREGWFQYLAHQGYIVACADNRGTRGRGTEFKKCVYGELGKCETEDQIEFAKHLAKLKYVDKNRIGIYGWSFGGYMTLLCMEKAPDLFKMGISVAPLTDWKYYDTGFTERYMKKPSENPEGYKKSSALYNASKIKGSLLLVHGSLDDNVHMQHSIELIKNLIRYDVPYDFLLFPDNNHNINNGNALLYLHKRMTEYIMKNL